MFNERFTTTAAQLGDDQAAVRLAGVHAMAGLADDWEENRQTCIDVLCAYLRMPYEPNPGRRGPNSGAARVPCSREVRHTAIRVITAHLKKNAPVSWQGLSFDFTGVVFDGGDFSDALFSGGSVNFTRAVFSGEVSFARARFSGGEVNFITAEFSGGEVDFAGAEFSGGLVNFAGARFSGGEVNFSAEFSGGEVGFTGAVFIGGLVYFAQAMFIGGSVTSPPPSSPAAR